MSLLKSIDECLVLHPRFVEIFDTLTTRIDRALDGDQQPFSWVTGPSRIGKSQLCHELAAKYPPVMVNGQRRISVLVVSSPTSTTAKSLPASVLRALGVHVPPKYKSAQALDAFLLEQLLLAGTRVIVFDEASQTVEKGASLNAFSVGEWLKKGFNENGLSQVLLGVPRLEKLTKANQQTRARSFKQIDWRPYDATIAAELDSYAGVVNTFLDVFKQEGWGFGISEEAMALNCYLQSPGLVGGLKDFLKEVARSLNKQAPRVLTIEDFRRAADVLESHGHPQYPPFQKENVTMVELAEAFKRVMLDNA